MSDMYDSLEHGAPQSSRKTTSDRHLVLKRRNQIAALRAGDRVMHFAFARGKSTCFSS
jgi:hypothetical protein